jgi:hypothetical protein
VRQDPLQGRKQRDVGIVRVGHRAVARVARGDEPQEPHLLLGDGHGEKQSRAEDAAHAAAPLIPHPFGVERGEVVGHEPAHPLTTARLLVRHGREDDRAAEAHALLEERFEGQKEDDSQALRVKRAAPPDEAVGDVARERGMRPPRRVRGDDIEVMVDEKRLERLAAGDPGHDQAAAGRGLVDGNVRGDPAPHDLVAEPLRRGHLVSWRVRRVELDVAAHRGRGIVAHGVFIAKCGFTHAPSFSRIFGAVRWPPSALRPARRNRPCCGSRSGCLRCHNCHKPGQEFGRYYGG